jgi:hypothetical protein
LISAALRLLFDFTFKNDVKVPKVPSQSTVICRFFFFARLVASTCDPDDVRVGAPVRAGSGGRLAVLSRLVRELDLDIEVPGDGLHLRALRSHHRPKKRRGWWHLSEYIVSTDAVKYETSLCVCSRYDTK